MRLLPLMLTLMTMAVVPTWIDAKTPKPPPGTVPPTTTPRPPGGKSVVQLTPELESLLYTSIANQSLYDDTVGLRLCVTDIYQVEFGVCAGQCYTYTTKTCDIGLTLMHNFHHNPTPGDIDVCLGKCTPAFDGNCLEMNATIDLYLKWDHSVHITGIGARPIAPPDPNDPITHRPQMTTPPPPPSIKGYAFDQI